MASRIAIGLGTAALLAVAAAVALDARAPAPDAGARLLAAASEASGLKVEAAGPAELSLFPTPRLRVGGVRVSRGDEPAFAVARELVGAIRIGALVAGRMELGEITLDAPEIALDRLPIAEGLAGLGARKADGFAPPSIRVTGGRLIWRGHVVDKVEGGLAWPRGAGPLAVSGVGRYEGRTVEATAQLGDLMALARSEASPFRGRIEGGGARLMFDGEARDAGGLRLVGEISARTRSLGDALDWLGAAQSVSGKTEAEKAAGGWSVSIAGRGSLDATGLDVSNAELDIAGESFLGAGRLTAARDGTPALEATLDAETLELDPYLKVLAPNLAQGGEWSAAALDLSGLRGWSLDLRLSADKVRFGQHKIGPAAATVAVAGGALDISLGEAAAYGGDVGGRLSLEPRGASARMRLETAATDVSLEDALAALTGRPPVIGSLTGELSVEGVGGSISEIVAALKGASSLRIADGALQTIGRNRTLALAGLKDHMEISASEAHLKIESGVATTNDVSIVGPAASLTLAGTASFVDGGLAMKGWVRPAQSTWTLPVEVEGKLSAPKLRPDLSGKGPRGEARRDSGAATP